MVLGPHQSRGKQRVKQLELRRLFLTLMEMLHVGGICDLTVDSYVKVREKHDGATGFL